MADLFSTNVLTGVIRNLKPAPSFLLDRYFGTIQTETSEEIHFDVDDGKRTIAPFVSPVVAGQVMISRGFTTHTFKPAYVKPKHVFDPSRPLKRAMGEQIGGSFNPADRARLLLARDLEDQIDMINRRLEVMAGEALRSGQITVSGDNYPTQVVDYGRNAGQTVVLGAGSKWNDAGVNPLDDLQDWSDTVLQAVGSAPLDVVMTVDVWKVFRTNANVKDRLDLRKASQGEIDLGAQQVEGGVFRGSIDGFNIFTYASWYVDPATGLEVPILPAATVMLIGATEGVRAFGAIRDELAGYQATPFFSKSWIENDPPVRYLMTQSAPLVVPSRVNATLAATVL